MKSPDNSGLFVYRCLVVVSFIVFVEDGLYVGAFVEAFVRAFGIRHLAIISPNFESSFANVKGKAYLLSIHPIFERRGLRSNFFFLVLEIHIYSF